MTEAAFNYRDNPPGTPMAGTGTLFVVATPIGNLEDLTFRALRTLKEVDLIAAEDTRRTAKLLAHYAVRKPMVSLREHNERRETPRILARLQAGQSVALVSDAGTPGISDPGQHLVRSAHEAGIHVSPIPGPSAVTAALSTSGEPASHFVFMGFPPRSGHDREIWFKDLSQQLGTVVFFESPHRIERTISELAKYSINRPIQLHREITKINEELVIKPNVSDVTANRAIGEFVVIVGKSNQERYLTGSEPEAIGIAAAMFDCLTNNKCFDEEVSIRLAATATSLDERAVRRAVKKARIARKRSQEPLP
jgi:16S rRNA (cytidine1402-2'-O)-methyltransferase